MWLSNLKVTFWQVCDSCICAFISILQLKKEVEPQYPSNLYFFNSKEEGMKQSFELCSCISLKWTMTKLSTLLREARTEQALFLLTFSLQETETKMSPSFCSWIMSTVKTLLLLQWRSHRILLLKSNLSVPDKTQNLENGYLSRYKMMIMSCNFGASPVSGVCPLCT